MDDIALTYLGRIVPSNYNTKRLEIIAEIKDGVLFSPSQPHQNAKPQFLPLGKDEQELDVDTIGYWYLREPIKSVSDFHDIGDLQTTLTYQPLIVPKLIVPVTNSGSLEKVKLFIQRGVTNNLHHCDTVFCCKIPNGPYLGLLCHFDNFTSTPKRNWLNIDFDALKICQFYDEDVFESFNGLYFFKSPYIDFEQENKVIQVSASQDDLDQLLETPLGRAQAHKFNQEPVLAKHFLSELNPEQQRQVKTNIILNTFLARLDKLASPSQVQECNDLIQRVLKESSIYTEIAFKLDCTYIQAKNMVENFAHQVKDPLTAMAIESDTLAQLIRNDDELFHRFETALKEQWLVVDKDYRLELKSELQSSKNQLEQIKSEFKTLTSKKHQLIQEIDQYQIKEDLLLESIQSFEEVEQELTKAAKDRSKQAPNAPSIDSIEQFSSEVDDDDESATQPSEPCAPHIMYEHVTNSHWIFVEGQEYHPDDVNLIAECKNWPSICDVLIDNLEMAGVRRDFSEMFSSFICSAFINRLPIMLVGPNGHSLANAISIALQGTTIPLLKCYGEINQDVLTSFTQNQVVAVENPFHPEWLSAMPQLTENQFSMWLHPFVEDLALKPHSLWNYVFPVITDCLVDSSATDEKLCMCTILKPFKAFQRNSQSKAKLSFLDSFGVNTLMFKRLNHVLADAKQMCSKQDVSMEFLFALLPLCLINHKIDLLGTAIDANNHLMPKIEKELKRYAMINHVEAS